MPRIALCLLLLCASTSVAARAPMHGSNDDNGSCPEIAAAVAAADVRGAKARATPAPAASRKASKPAVRGGGESEGNPRLQAPRWHSFLPGMFR